MALLLPDLALAGSGLWTGVQAAVAHSDWSLESLSEVEGRLDLESAGRPRHAPSSCSPQAVILDFMTLVGGIVQV